MNNHKKNIIKTNRLIWLLLNRKEKEEYLTFAILVENVKYKRLEFVKQNLLGHMIK